MCLYNLFYSIQLSLPTMPNNSLALTCCSSQLQNLVSLGCHQTKSQSSIIAQQSDSFGCNKWRYSTQPFGYTTIYIHIYLYIHTYIYGTFSICRVLFCQRFENSNCYIYSGGRFLCRSLEAVIFCFLVSFSAVYSSFDIQSYFKLVKKFIQQIWVSFLFSSKYIC